MIIKIKNDNQRDDEKENQEERQTIYVKLLIRSTTLKQVHLLLLF